LKKSTFVFAIFLLFLASLLLCVSEAKAEEEKNLHLYLQKVEEEVNSKPQKRGSVSLRKIEYHEKELEIKKGKLQKLKKKVEGWLDKQGIEVNGELGIMISSGDSLLFGIKKNKITAKEDSYPDFSLVFDREKESLLLLFSKTK